MWLVINVVENQVSGVAQYLTEDVAVGNAVALAVEQGATEDEDTIAKELREEGQYIPNKHPEWSVSVVKVHPAATIKAENRDKAKALKAKVKEFDAAGGRGVELADEIDALRLHLYGSREGE